ncbi:TetR/AcrR family transcriptional regulator [Amphritea sp.]|uniref:TetR/AcrR family transcriptional regulator n=1 Tax=Amphritea sp. TaxID=1872502 RepID=UPI003D104B95
MMKKRGRPPGYDHNEALDNAIQVFWTKGLTATSLDDLAAAMKMNRPSIYNAFGNKTSIYRKAFARFVAELGEQLDRELFGEPDLNKAMKQFYRTALDTYFTGTVPLGCFVTSTAVVEAAAHPEIREDLEIVINRVDSVIEKRLLAAQQDGSWPKDRDANNVAKLLHATLQSLAVRARGGESRTSLETMYSGAVDMLC